MTTDHASELSEGAQRLLADIDRIVDADTYNGGSHRCCLFGQVCRTYAGYWDWDGGTAAFVAQQYDIPLHAAHEIYGEAAEEEYAHDLPSAKAMAARILVLTHA